MSEQAPQLRGNKRRNLRVRTNTDDSKNSYADVSRMIHEFRGMICDSSLTGTAAVPRGMV